MLAQAVANQGVAPPQVSTLATRIQELMRINPPEFHGYKADEGPKKFIDKAYKIVVIMGVSQMKRSSLWPINLTV